MTEEFNALISNQTWILVPRPSTANVVNCIRLFKKKHNLDGSLARYKARLVTNGRNERPYMDCDETFSLVVKPANGPNCSQLSYFIPLVGSPVGCEEYFSP